MKGLPKKTEKTAFLRKKQYFATKLNVFVKVIAKKPTLYGFEGIPPTPLGGGGRDSYSPFTMVLYTVTTSALLTSLLVSVSAEVRPMPDLGPSMI